MKSFICSWGTRSVSAKELCKGLCSIRVDRKRPYKGLVTLEDRIINWGLRRLPTSMHPLAKVLNKPCSVSIASDKLKSFIALEKAGVSVPAFSTDKQPSVGSDTVVRHVLRGQGGSGIEVVKDGTPLPQAPLYVQYIKRSNEYRVHVVCGKVISVQRKARKRSVPDSCVDWQVRNHKNGFIFERNSGKEYPTYVREEGLKAVVALGLDFGAVDIVTRKGKAYVLEVNTAPGLTNTTLEEWINAFQEAGYSDS